MQVKGVLDTEEVLFAKNKGYLWGTHVVVGLPECLAEASKEPHAIPIMQHTRAVAVDEVDACFLVSVLLPRLHAMAPPLQACFGSVMHCICWYVLLC